MLSWSINLFRIRGIQLSLHFSFFLLLGYAAWEGFWDEGLNGLLWSSILLISFFTCVVLHELGHSLMAKYFGIQVRRILLMPIGGMAEFETIPKEPYK
jgi:Zn-dependent protease